MIVFILSVGSVLSSLVWFRNVFLMSNNGFLHRVLPLVVIDESLWFIASLGAAAIAIASLLTGCSAEPNFSQFVFIVANIVTIPIHWFCLSLDVPLSWIVTGGIVFRLVWRSYIIAKSHPIAKGDALVVCFLIFTYMPFALLGHLFWTGWE